MAFNHYAKIKRILDQQPSDWVIKIINKPTSASKFNGEIVIYPYYYRIFDNNDKPIKYCKFQQIERLAKILGVNVQDLPIINNLE